MEIIHLNTTKNSEEILIKLPNVKFIVRHSSVGQYGFGKIISLYVMKNDFTKEKITSIGYSKEEISWTNDNLVKNITITGCLVTNLITFEQGLELAKNYINKIL